MNPDEVSDELDILRIRTQEYRGLLTSATGILLTLRDTQVDDEYECSEGIKRFLEKMEEHGIVEDNDEQL